MSEKSTVTITGPGVYKTDANGDRVVKDGQPVFHNIGADVDLAPAEARAVVDSGQAVFKNKTEEKAASPAAAPTK